MAGLAGQADHLGMNTCSTCLTFSCPRRSRRPGQILRSLPLGLLLLSAAHLCSAQRMAAPSKSHTSQATATHLHQPGLRLLTISTGSSASHGWRSLFTGGGSSSSSAPHHGEGFHPGDGLPVDDALDWYKRVRSTRHLASSPRRQTLGLFATRTGSPSRGIPDSAQQTGNPPPKFLERLSNALPNWLDW